MAKSLQAIDKKGQLIVKLFRWVPGLISRSGSARTSRLGVVMKYLVTLLPIS